MEAAILWHLTPSSWLAAPEIDRAIMLAHYRERNMRKAMLAKLQHDAAAKPDKPERTSPAHDAFFAGSGLTGLPPC